jgi:predicted RecB family nuclease
MRISKSKFVAGVQCLKRLYLQVHQPGLAAELDEASKAVIEQGRQVGLVAQKAFPGGVIVEAGPKELDKAITKTRELIAASDVPAIFEATFQHEGVLVRTDVLKRNGRSGHGLIEVKSATAVKPHYAYDIAIQRHVLTGADVEIKQASLMHLNRKYVFDGKDYDVSQLFVIAELKPKDSVSDSEISDRLKDQFRVLNRHKPPDIKPGKQCKDPVLCEFYDHCNPELPADHVSHLPRIQAKKVEELTAAGITLLKQIPDAFPLSERQRRAVDCVKSGKPFVSPELADELDGLKYPLCFMDFETVFPALPRFAKMGPYDHIPFQWSVHRQGKPGGPLKHHEFLAENDSDPRFPFVESLCKALAGAGNIVVYNQSFESSRLDDLARWLPAYASDIKKIKAKIWDLLVVVRRNVYHPEFAGSFSLKFVLPAFVPEMTYGTLEVAEGTAAGLAWARLIQPGTALVEKRRLRKALLEYCKQDTLALAKLFDVLRKHPRAALQPSTDTAPASS